MIKLISLLVTLFFCYKIINGIGYRRLLWVVGGLLLLCDLIVVTNKPFFPVSRVLIFSLLISELIRYKYFKKQVSNFPLIVPLTISFIGLFIIGIFDERLSLFQKFYQPFAYITNSFFIIILGYASIKDKDDLHRIIKPLTYISIFMFLYGIFNYFSKSNPYFESLARTFSTTTTELNRTLSGFGDINRYRVSSTVNLSFNYGYFSIILFLLFLFLSNNKIKQKAWLILGTISGFGGVFLSGSRTVLIVFLVGFVLYILLVFKFHKLIKILLLSNILLFVTYNSISIIKKQIDAIADVYITGGEGVGGSSIKMRNNQFTASLALFAKSPIIGNGYGYIEKELDYNKNSTKVSDELQGFESYLYNLLIEQGIIGIISSIIIYITLLLFFFKNIKTSIQLSALGICIISAFLLFAIGTGILGSFPISMLLIGIIIKSIELQSNYTDYLFQK